MFGLSPVNLNLMFNRLYKIWNRAVYCFHVVYVRSADMRVRCMVDTVGIASDSRGIATPAFAAPACRCSAHSCDDLPLSSRRLAPICTEMHSIWTRRQRCVIPDVVMLSSPVNLAIDLLMTLRQSDNLCG